MKSVSREVFELLCIGILTIIIVLGLLFWLAPRAGAYTQKTLDKEAEAEMRLQNIEARITILESKCAIGATNDLSQRVIALEAESKEQKGLLNIIFDLMVKLQGLIVQLLGKLAR